MDYNIEDVRPETATIFKRFGVPDGAEVSEVVKKSLDMAYDIFNSLCRAKGIIGEISTPQFDAIYKGDGKNEADNPVADIFPQSKYLALFTVTLGPELSDKICELFKVNDFVLAVMLDTLASEATEKAGVVTENWYMNYLSDKGSNLSALAAVRYSPGYCGWHLSGQKKLFEYLKPGEIGVELNDSFLMLPMKSISGVMIVGDRDIHKFDPAYSFCRTCMAPSCLSRIDEVLGDDRI
jgi:hypothetical protein